MAQEVLGRPKVDERIEAAIRRSLEKGNGTKKNRAAALSESKLR